MPGMMDKDFYAVLGLTRSANQADIRKTFRQLSLEFHPDRNQEAGAEDKFGDVAEAYTVLSDPQNRAIYDQYDYQGLLEGAPKGATDFTEPFTYHGDAYSVFKSFFGTDNPFQDLFPPKDEFGLSGEDPSRRTRRKQSPPIERDLRITLEEAFIGCVKKMKISRMVMNDDGHTSTSKDKILTVIVKPGWKEGTRVTFPKEGDQGPNNIPADVVFIIKYKDHPRFIRQGYNLVHTAKISLADALCGCIVELITLDNRKLCIPVNDVISPGFSVKVPNEGMPHTREPSKRGDLVLQFDTAFPPNLSEEQKVLVRQAFK